LPYIAPHHIVAALQIWGLLIGSGPAFSRAGHERVGLRRGKPRDLLSFSFGLTDTSMYRKCILGSYECSSPYLVLYDVMPLIYGEPERL